MKLSVDNDAIHKLSVWDLLGDGLAGLEVEPADCRVLPTAKYKFHVAKKQHLGKEEFGDAVHKRIEDFIRGAHELADPIDPADECLSSVAGIDSGEALLFAVTSRDSAARVLTGDKRAIRALAEAQSCAGVAGRLSGKIICIEQVLVRAINATSFEYVKSRVLSSVDIDTATRAAFGSGALSTETNVVAALSGYVDELRACAGGMLMPD